MRPEITLDGAALRANVAAFAALGAPVAAVVKHDGYGWGARLLARELDAVVESYVVSDEDELAALRPATDKPVRLLFDAAPGRLARVLALGGIPNVSSRAALAEAADAAPFAQAMAGTGLAVELWTHVVSTARGAAILEAFVAARRAFEAAGVPVVATDVASTASSRRGLAFDRLRVGVGLFGARLGASVDNRCAVRVTAPVVRTFAPGEAGWAGYGDARVVPHRAVAVLRSGYGDGFPKNLADGVDILSVGMQYTARVMHEGVDVRALIGEADDVDTLAARSGILPHELIVGLAPR